MPQFSANQIAQLRRNAKRLVREQGLTHSESLDRQARTEGYGNWSQLMKHAEPAAPASHSQRIAAAGEVSVVVPDVPGLPRLVATREERRIIMDIAKRFARVVGEDLEVDMLGIIMDIEACHCNGMPIDLVALLEAPREEDLIHDVAGIGRYLNRETGKLEQGFRPRHTLPHPVPRETASA